MILLCLNISKYETEYRGNTWKRVNAMQDSKNKYRDIKHVLINAYQKGNDQSAELDEIMAGLRHDLKEYFNYSNLQQNSVSKKAQ